MRAALEHIIERAGAVEVSAASVVAAVKRTLRLMHRGNGLIGAKPSMCTSFSIA